MDNNQSINFFKEFIKNNPEKGTEKYGHDNSDIDASFLLRYVNSSSRILDIGSGSGLIINKIEPNIRHITAVEPLLEFSRYIKKSERIEIVNQSIFDFDPSNAYDLVTLFGFMHYLNKDEAEIIYKKCYHWLNSTGKIIIKNQFGIFDDVTVDGYSEE